MAIKKLKKSAKIPKQANEGDAGYDLVATSKRNADYGRIEFGTGLAFAIPPGYVGLVFPRSSISKTDLVLSNSVGVIDSGYRGEVKLKFNRIPYGDEYEVGDRIGQLIVMPIPYVEFVQVDDLGDTQRGTGGWGSSGK